ncbi:MAG: hypothetical protein ACREFF_10090, partial [Candidatus Udaeobacter sp.]
MKIDRTNATKRIEKLDVNPEKRSALTCGFGRYFLRRDLKSFDLFFDFVGESRRPCAVYNPVVECERERNYFRAFVSVFVR